MITSRNVEILEYLSSNKTSNIEELTNELSVSERTIKYDIDNINYFLEQNKLAPIKKLSKGDLVFETPKELWKNLIIEKDLYEMSSEERRDYLSIKLFFERDYVTINPLADKLEVGQTTINKDLKELKRIYKDKGIDFLSNSRKGIKILGEENEIRNIQLSLMLKYLQNYQNFLLGTDYEISKIKILNLIKESLKSDFTKYIRKFIKLIESNMETNISDEIYSIILGYMIVIFLNIQQGHPLKRIDNEFFLESTKEYKVIKKISKDLKDYLQIVPNQHELLMITDLFISSCFFHTGASYYDNWIDISFLTKTLINSMDKQLDKSIANDKELYFNLRNHLKPMIYRIKNNIELNNSIVKEAKETYKEMFKHTEIACETLNELLEIKITQSEIAFICQHFKLAIDRSIPNKVEVKPKNVVLICAHGYGTSNLIAEELIKTFYINIIDIIPHHSLNLIDLKLLDCIITTVPVNKNIGVEVIQVNPIMEKEDFSELENLGFKKKNKRILLTELMKIIEKNTNETNNIQEKLTKELLDNYYGIIIDDRKKISSLDNLLLEDQIRFDVDINEWKDIVSSSVSLLEKNNCVNSLYEAEIIDAIEVLGERNFLIGDGIALLHATPEKNIHKTSFSLLTTTKPVVFPKGNKIDTFFCLAVKNKGEHINALMELMELIKKDKFKEKIKDFFKNKGE